MLIHKVETIESGDSLSPILVDHKGMEYMSSYPAIEEIIHVNWPEWIRSTLSYGKGTRRKPSTRSGLAKLLCLAPSMPTSVLHITNTPYPGLPYPGFRDMDSPDMDFPDTENPAVLNIDILITDLRNTDLRKTHPPILRAKDGCGLFAKSIKT